MDLWAFVSLVQSELFLFCAFFFLLGAIDDIAFDIGYVGQRLCGGLKKPLCIDDLNGSDAVPVAVFLPAWQEADVIGATLDHMAMAFGRENATIIVGCYPNDDATLAAVRRAMARHPRIRLAINDRPGPTTKGDCLNSIWRAMLEMEMSGAQRYSAIVLHDAEDVVHVDEIAVHRHFLRAHRLSQLPVIPIVPRESRWLSGHYADEFAEAHGKEMRVRQATGAALPSAGVGCAFRRDYLDERAGLFGDRPFPAMSLVEDYELGLAVAQGGSCRSSSALALVSGRDGSLVATRALFPSDLDAVVRQKARWIAGIALAGWDRLGWHHSFAEIWMRLHDRRSVFAAFVIALSYFLFALSFCRMLAGMLIDRPGGLPEDWQPLAALCFLNLCYRMVVRAAFVRPLHGWRQALFSLPRTFIGNIMVIMASWRAVLIYARHCFGAPLKWDKTVHRPLVMPGHG